MATADGVLLHCAAYRRCLAVSPDPALPGRSAFQHPYGVPLQDDVSWEADMAGEWGIGISSSSSEVRANGKYTRKTFHAQLLTLLPMIEYVQAETLECLNQLARRMLMFGGWLVFQLSLALANNLHEDYLAITLCMPSCLPVAADPSGYRPASQRTSHVLAQPCRQVRPFQGLFGRTGKYCSG
ncbi:uncharacterized protein [Miscanthus floridulus]|uniref:uncharacterized protein n=1 Tax=Miscanthus floridulus TaxID=154761 RepID=UPI00345B2FF9